MSQTNYFGISVAQQSTGRGVLVFISPKLRSFCECFVYIKSIKRSDFPLNEIIFSTQSFQISDLVHISTY